MTPKRYAELVASHYPHGLEQMEGVDPKIQTIVDILRANGVETCQSCQGGKGHSYPEPTVDFYGSDGAGWKALAIAKDFAMPVSELRRKWSIQDGVPAGPLWQMTFVESKLPAFNASWK